MQLIIRGAMIMGQDMKKHLTILFSALEREHLLGMLCRDNPSMELMREIHGSKRGTSSLSHKLQAIF